MCVMCFPYLDLLPLTRLAASSRLTMGLLTHEAGAGAYHVEHSERTPDGSTAYMGIIVKSDAECESVRPPIHGCEVDG